MRDPDCVDTQNGQDLPEYGIGYEPSLAIDGHGNMFITAHKDLRWSSPDGGLANPLGGDPHVWPDGSCMADYMPSWDYLASWFWASYDYGASWGPGDGFQETPGSVLDAWATYGATDEFGHNAIEDVVNHFDYHRTLLHLFGLDAEALTFKLNGREQTLLD